MKIMPQLGIEPPSLNARIHYSTNRANPTNLQSPSFYNLLADAYVFQAFLRTVARVSLISSAAETSGLSKQPSTREYVKLAVYVMLVEKKA